MWNPFRKGLPALRMYSIRTTNGGKHRVVAQDCQPEEVGGIGYLNFVTLKAEGERYAPTAAIFKLVDILEVESEQIDMQELSR